MMKCCMCGDVFDVGYEMPNGDGGMPQYFVKNIETEIDNGTLVRGTSYSLNNSEITNTDYYKMVGEAKMKYAGGLE